MDLTFLSSRKLQALNNFLPYNGNDIKNNIISYYSPLY